MLIDDFQRPDHTAAFGGRWRVVSDRVMGGISLASMTSHSVDGRSGLRLSGEVRLDNNGGFVQLALDLAPAASVFDASAFTGVEIVAHGNDEDYKLHLRTADATRPWQSYRSQFHAAASWQTYRLPFAGFRPHRLSAPLDLRRLRRLGIVAIGREFVADLTLGELRFY